MPILLFFLRAARWGMLLVGIVFLFVGAGVGLRTRSFQAHSLQADGTVVANRAQTDPQGSTVFYPQFSFTPAGAAAPVTVDSHSGSNPASFHVGDAVKIRYAADDSSNAAIDTPGQLYLLPIIFLCLAPLLILGSFVFRYFVRKLQASQGGGTVPVRP